MAENCADAGPVGHGIIFSLRLVILAKQGSQFADSIPHQIVGVGIEIVFAPLIPGEIILVDVR